MVLTQLGPVVSTVTTGLPLAKTPASQVKILPQNSMALTVSAMVDISAHADEEGSELDPVWFAVADADAPREPPEVAVGR